MNIYKARYRNALKKAARGNRLLKKGYTLTDTDGQVLDGPFYLEGNEVLLKTGENCSYIIFINDKELDNGYHTSINDFNKEMKEYKFIPKECVVSL
jgi:hypothetical protein